MMHLRRNNTVNVPTKFYFHFENSIVAQIQRKIRAFCIFLGNSVFRLGQKNEYGVDFYRNRTKN